MAVIIGSARGDERGGIKGGTAGDQTGREVATEYWYRSSKQWYLLRALDPDVAEKIAVCMEKACKNDNYGYDQSNNQSGIIAARPYGWDPEKVTYPVEIDCSQLVRLCVSYALGYEVPYFYTGDEVQVLMATGAFKLITDTKYTESSDYLRRGDILVTRSKGHTVVVLSDGPKAYDGVLDIDGVLGRNSVYWSQVVLGTHADGEVWNQKSSQKKYLKACSKDAWKFKLWPQSNSEFVCALQVLVGAKVTGWMDQNTVKAMQRFLKARGFYKAGEDDRDDGYLGSDTAKAWQRFINSQL